MTYKANFKLTRQDKATPFFGDWLMTQPESQVRTAFITINRARKAASFTKDTVELSPDGLTTTSYHQYPDEETYKTFMEIYAKEMEVIKQARNRYEKSNKMTRSLTFIKE